MSIYDIKLEEFYQRTRYATELPDGTTIKDQEKEKEKKDVEETNI